MATLHFFGGEKGGVGKTFVARIAVQYLLDRGVDFALFDADRSSSDIKRFYQDINCGEAIFNESEKYEDAALQICVEAEKKATLVNLPPQVLFALKGWFSGNDIVKVAKEGGIIITHWFVCSGHPDSVRLLDKYLAHFKGTINHVLVKNLIDACDWSCLDENEDIQQKLQEYQVKILDFPKFSFKSALDKINYSDLTFGEARESKNFDSLDRHRVKSFLESAYSQFDKAGVFNGLLAEVH